MPKTIKNKVNKGGSIKSKTKKKVKNKVNKTPEKTKKKVARKVDFSGLRPAKRKRPKKKKIKTMFA